MRILVDYRPALRQRTGVGEYVHALAGALAATPDPTGAPDTITLFSSSWKDRPAPAALADLGGLSVVDRRIPVSVLTWCWNRWAWPPIETLAGACDVAHSASPLLLPARSAAQVITIHDLHFLRHPERMTAEMRRDFPRLAAAHAQRAHAIVVSSRFGMDDVARTLGVAHDRIYLCPPGAPGWAADLGRTREAGSGRHILCLGTLEPRKNLGVLLDAYALLAARVPDAPPLVLAGGVTPAAQAWVDRTTTAPLAGRVEVTGYVGDERRRALLADARMLVMPSLDEGFGLPVLEAMAAGVPVVVSSGGSLPEVAGEAAEPVDPSDVEGFAAAMARLLDRDAAIDATRRAGRRARDFDWHASAATVRRAYRDAVARR